MLGDCVDAMETLPGLRAAAAAVDAAGAGKVGQERSEARQAAALREGYRLVKRLQVPTPSPAALSLRSKEGSTAVLCFAAQFTIHGQCKGRQIEVSPGQTADFLAKLKRAAIKSNPELPARMELLLAGSASDDTKAMKWASKIGGEKEKRELSEKALTGKDFAIVLKREHLSDALGPVFGDIAARCTE